MELTRSVKQVVIKRVKVSILLFLAIYLIGHYLLPLMLIGTQYKDGTVINVSVNSANIFINLFYGIGFLLVLLYLLSSFYIMVKGKGGQWKVVVNEQGLHWQTPNEGIEASFFIPFEQMDYIALKSDPLKKKTGRFQYITAPSQGKKVIVTKEGKTHEIHTNSGIKLDEIYSELIRLGVPFSNDSTQ